jgi:hypothetical protein
VEDAEPLSENKYAALLESEEADRRADLRAAAQNLGLDDFLESEDYDNLTGSRVGIDTAANTYHDPPAGDNDASPHNDDPAGNPSPPRGTSRRGWRGAQEKC